MPANSKKLREGHVQTVIGIKPNYVITLTAGHHCSADVLKTAGKHFFNRLQRAAYGRAFLRRPAKERPTAIGFFEHPDTNPHLHIAAHLPTEPLQAAADSGEKIWRKIRVAGSYHAEPLVDVERWARYITKDTWDLRTERTFEYTPEDSWVAHDVTPVSHPAITRVLW